MTFSWRVDKPDLDVDQLLQRLPKAAPGEIILECVCCSAWRIVSKAEFRSDPNAISRPCPCTDNRCALCNQCSVHCAHPCPVCGKTGVSSRVRLEDGQEIVQESVACYEHYKQVALLLELRSDHAEIEWMRE